MGKPFLASSQRTWSPDDGRPLHGEAGYWRFPGEVEIVLAHTTGHAEVGRGTLSGQTIACSSTQLVATPSAKGVQALRRQLVVDGDVLSYRLEMSALGHPMQAHLRAELRRST